MTFPKYLPRLQRLGHTNLNPGYRHAILISVLRALAAAEVAAAHLRAQLYPSLKSLPDPTFWYQVLAFFTGFAHQGVVIFFVLSGWLVGGSLLNKLNEPGIMLSYAIDRLTRLWIVLIPAFLLTLLISIAFGQVLPHEPDFSSDNPYSFTAFVGNLLGLQDMAVPRFGGNFALWSLANETWYYVLFPLVLLPFTGKAALVRIAALLIGAISIVWLHWELLLYFAIWLLGVAFSRLRIDAPPPARWIMLGALLGTSVYFRLTGSNDILVAASFVQDLVFSVLFLAYLSSLQFEADGSSRATRIARRAGAFFSGFSFTLYVIHVPLLLMLRHLFASRLGAGLAPDSAADFGVYAALLAAIIALAYLFHLPFEAQTHRVRRMIKEWVLGRPLRQRAMQPAE